MSKQPIERFIINVRLQEDKEDFWERGLYKLEGKKDFKDPKPKKKKYNNKNLK